MWLLKQETHLVHLPQRERVNGVMRMMLMLNVELEKDGWA